jgi:formylglycine-generating enzyme required for sulfatase activity
LAEDDLLARLNAKEGPLVLIVDQLEEAFVVGSLESQDAFFSFVRRFLEYGTAIHRSDNPGRRRVVLAMRDDFVHRLLRQQHLFPELLRNTLLVAALNIDQARSAIAEPALHAGLRYDPELLNELIKALSHDGVVRPSELQIVCDALYNHRTEGASTIDFDTYRRAGDVSTILGTYLDRVLESLGKSQEAGKKLLAAMVSPELTSVPLSMSRAMNIVLYSGLQETALEGLLGTLENARLIKRTSHADPEWELAHEFLIDRIQRDFDDRDVQIMNLRANLRQGQSTWVGGYPLEVLDQATRLHDEAGLNPGDSARLLASAVTHGSHLEHWIKANVSNERVDEVVAPLLHHEDTEIVRRAAVALSFVSHADESRESVLNRLRSSGNPKVIAALRDLESRLGALSKNYWDKLKLAISLRLRHDLVEIPAATFEVGTSRNDILAILNRQNIPFSEVFFEGQYPAKSAECGRFWIDKFLVTNADFKEFDSFHTFPKGNELHPVTDVKWQDAERYAAWLGKRLATSAEWERAGRGPDGFAFPWGNEWRYDACNTRVSGFGGTTEVTAFPQGVSPFGCYDMAGNVWEWTADRATARSWELLPPDKSQPERRVLKGGSWTQMGILPWLWHRFDYPESEGYQNVGFRCVTDRPDPFDEVLND